MHARVERWALDEVPLSGKLVHQLVDWLYHEDRLCRGELLIGGKRIGPQTVTAPMLAIVNGSDGIAPHGSIEPFTRAIGNRDVGIVEYPGELGLGLEHLAVLIGKRAHAQLWPEIISWIRARC
jgi:polyhydroxyalkanoate synthase